MLLILLKAHSAKDAFLEHIPKHAEERILEQTAQKMKFSIKDFSSKCDQIRKRFSPLKMSLENVNTQKIKKQEMLVNLVYMRTRLTSSSCFLSP